jgi:hypothetical protein
LLPNKLIQQLFTVAGLRTNRFTEPVRLNSSVRLSVATRVWFLAAIISTLKKRNSSFFWIGNKVGTYMFYRKSNKVLPEGHAFCGNEPIHLRPQAQKSRKPLEMAVFLLLRTKL